MKRIIVTSICTLALSLLGVFGANQNASNSNNQLYTTSHTTSVEQNVTDTEDQNLPTEIEATVSDHTSKDTDAVKTEVTPVQINKEDATVSVSDNKEVSKKATATSNNTVVKADTTSPVKVEAINVVVPSQNTEPVTNNLVSKPESIIKAETVSYTAPQANANSDIAKIIANAQNSLSNGTKNGQVIIYKNVNLSNCKSAADVISTLQKNGYNINSSNIQNIAGLKDILALIQNGQTANGGSTTTPTKAPTPVPTEAPTPVPTKTPTPVPTKTPTLAPTKAPTKAPTQAPTKAPTPAPTKAPTPTTAPTNNSGISSYANQVLQLVNVERAKAGLSAYTTNSALTSAANLRAKETVQSFSHTRPNGSSFSTVLKEYNISYRAAGENIAYGQRTPQEVVTGWMNSPGHRANILNSNFNKIGVGVYQTSNGTIYWSQEFTN